MEKAKENERYYQMKRFKTQANIARDIMAGKKPETEVETPLDNPEAEQEDTPSAQVAKKYCKKGVHLAQVKSKIIDNA